MRLALHDDGVADDVEGVPGVPGPRLRVEAGQEVGGGPVARLDQQDTQTDRQLEKREEMKDYSRTWQMPLKLTKNIPKKSIFLLRMTP